METRWRKKERDTELGPQNSGVRSPTGDRSVSAGHHSLGVGTVGAEGQGEGRSQDAQRWPTICCMRLSSAPCLCRQT